MFKVKKNQAAFTLVELLVVISIIALLLGILMPALNKARQQARLLICTVNSKQIGTTIAAYQADNGGAVPVMCNRWTAGSFPAKSRLLSVALSRYSTETVNLKNLPTLDGTIGVFDPDRDWGGAQDTGMLGKPFYFKKYLPKFYVCPFVRGKSTEDFKKGPPVVFKPGTTQYKGWIRTASGECYSVWRWEVKRDAELTRGHPLGLPHGTPKYGSLAWNIGSAIYPGAGWSTWNGVKDNPVILGDRTALKRANVSSMSQAAIVYCEQGQTDSHSAGSDPANGVYNYGSHKKGSFGGTNAIFADMHAEWVEGTRIGWP